MFSTKAEYGVRVMVELARRAGAQGDGGTADGGTADGSAGADPVVPLAEIAEHDGMPLAYLEHLVARLRKAGLLDSRRGSRGGYMLARPADQITMAEVVEALEGTIAPIECISQEADGSITCSRESGQAGASGAGLGQICPTKALWTRVRLSIVRTLVETTLADLLVSPAEARAAGVADRQPEARAAEAADRRAEAQAAEAANRQAAPPASAPALDRTPALALPSALDQPHPRASQAGLRAGPPLPASATGDAGRWSVTTTV